MNSASNLHRQSSPAEATAAARAQLDERSRAHLHASITRANGMMPMRVYEALWDASATTGGGYYVEIGTGHGAGTIALALGARAAGGNVSIDSIDRLGGRFSSRSAFGSPDENQAIVLANFAAAGVADNVRLFVGSSDEFVAAERTSDPIALLMIDADGRIDRDLLHFYDRMAPGAPIIFDDADDGVYLGTLHDGTRFIDLKHRITSLLIAAYRQAGFLEYDRTVESTAFCRRGARAMNREEFRDIALGCYRDLVLAPVSSSEWEQIYAWREAGMQPHLPQARRHKHSSPIKRIRRWWNRGAKSAA